MKVAVITRNMPWAAASFVSLTIAGRPAAAISAFQPAEVIAADIETTRFAGVIADKQDWSTPVIAAMRRTGAVGLVLDLDDSEGVQTYPGLQRINSERYAHSSGEAAIEILSSGTTGAPKRVALSPDAFAGDVKRVSSRVGSAIDTDIVIWPLAGIGGMSRLFLNIVTGRPMVLLEKFAVAEWVAAVRRYRPAAVNGPPTVLRMLLDAAVAPEDLSSVQYFYGGSAPLPQALKDEFEQRFAVKIVWAYGATEFGGTIIAWNADLIEQYGEAKKESIGRAIQGVQLRVVDTSTGDPLASTQIGYLEAISPHKGSDWIRTTDLVSIDDDGFAFHHGRGDGAILRGGFKILPERVVDCLRTHPAVLDAAVIGVPDERLGAVPAAVVELRSGDARPAESELIAHVRSLLPSNHVPVRVLVLDSLPRTASLKVDLGAVAHLVRACGQIHASPILAR